MMMMMMMMIICSSATFTHIHQYWRTRSEREHRLAKTIYGFRAFVTQLLVVSLTRSLLHAFASRLLPYPTPPRTSTSLRDSVSCVP